MPYVTKFNFLTLAYILVDLWLTFPQNLLIPPQIGAYLYVKFGSLTVICMAQTNNATDKRKRPAC